MTGLLVFFGFLAGCPRVDPTLLTDQLEREVVALHERVRRLQQELETCGEGPSNDALYRDLAQIYAEADGVFVDRRGASIVQPMPSSANVPLSDSIAATWSFRASA